jgi:hypothetical protein
VPLHIYRCGHCGREVLVRVPGPMSEQEIARRREEEMRPAPRGPRGTLGMTERLRDDIWLGVSSMREMIPRDKLPEQCPACGHASFAESRIIE